MKILTTDFPNFLFDPIRMEIDNDPSGKINASVIMKTWPIRKGFLTFLKDMEASYDCLVFLKNCDIAGTTISCFAYRKMVKSY